MIEKLKLLYKKYKEMILYIFFGGCTTIISIFSYWVFTLASISPYISNVLSWILSVLFAFITNKLLVFNSKDKTFKNILIEGSKFYFFRLLSLAIDMGIFYFLYSVLHINDLVVKIITNIIVIVINYVFSKLFIFRKSN